MFLSVFDEVSLLYPVQNRRLIPSNPAEYNIVCSCIVICHWLIWMCAMSVMSSQSWWGIIMPKEGMRWILCWVFLFCHYYPGAKMLKSRMLQHGFNEPVRLDMHSPVFSLHYWHMGGKESGPNPSFKRLWITSWWLICFCANEVLRLEPCRCHM